MKKIFIIWLFFIPYSSVMAQLDVAVIELQGKGIYQQDASILTDRLRIELHKTGKFTVLERDLMLTILKEQGFQLTGVVSEESAVKLGHIIGAKFIVWGSISRFEDLISVNARLIEVETGKVIKVATLDYSGEKSQLLKECMKNIANQLAGLSSPTSYSRPTNNYISQQKPKINYSSKFSTIGLEADLLPVLNQGYSGSVWYGLSEDSYSVKFICSYSKFKTPAIFLSDGFENDSLKLYSLGAELYFSNNFKSVYLGSGLQYYSGSIGHKEEILRGEYQYSRLSLTLGYTMKIFNKFYLKLWGGTFLFLYGNGWIKVGRKTFFIDKTVPIVSIAGGFHF